MKQLASIRLRRILAYEFSGQYSYECCDIPTRERIDRLIRVILKTMRDTPILC
jgi:hypothetical protein